jgi:hypothetical protein
MGRWLRVTTSPSTLHAPFALWNTRVRTVRSMTQPTQFFGGEVGPWVVEGLDAIIGEPLPVAPRLAIVEPAAGAVATSIGARWCLRGVTSNLRYTTSGERSKLAAEQPELGRPEATCAALIPIKKSAAWWDLAQDERREILEERSRHISIGLGYLPAIARRLYHCRDLTEPFDFVTWFEFAPEHTGAFDELLGALRASQEWHYVDREVDIRLSRPAKLHD